MADRPILFSAPMVRALLAGTKTQTRRILKPQPERLPNGGWHVAWQVGGGAIYGSDATDTDLASETAIGLRIQVGDQLWVRESGHLLREAYGHDPRQGEDLWRDAGFQHSADGAIVPARAYDPPLAEWIGDCSRTSRPSIHMPRWASRLTLTVTDVRVQQLQDISEEDARAEGWSYGQQMVDGILVTIPAPVAWYAVLWDRINGTGAWASNPWVAAYTFAVARQNIDALSNRPASEEG